MYNTTYAHTIVGSGATGRTNLGLETKTCLQHWQTGETCSCTDKVTTVFNIQGACADEEYAYFAFYVYYRKTDVTKHKNVTICQKIVCSKINSDGSFDLENATIRTFTNLEHANSLTYNNRTDEVVVAHCKQAVNSLNSNNVEYTEIPSEHFEVSTINAAYLRGETDTLSQKTHNISCGVTSIDYNKKDNVYIVGITGHHYSFAVLNQDFQLERVVEATNAVDYKAWSRQSSWCDGNYIYSAFAYYDDENEIRKNAISVIDFSSQKVVKEINFNLSDTDAYKYEIENLFELDGRLIASFICIGKGSFYYDLSELTATYKGENHAVTFEVQYYDNLDMTDDVASFMALPEESKEKSIVIYGFSTPLQRNRFSNIGYKFVGWALYAPATNRWRYEDSAGNKAWRTEPLEGETKCRYIDEQEVSATVSPGGVVILCAQWEPTEKFFLTFFNGDDTSVICEYTYGQSKVLPEHMFKSNIGSEFVGWHAYWVEKDKWYYVSSDGTTKKWYVEGKEPTGYRKFVYGDKATVKQTATAGGHIEMNAVWNEIKLYYYVGATDVAYNNIKVPLRVDLNSKKIYNYNNENKINWGTVTGYLYWIENDQWYCGTTWQTYTSSKTKTYKTISSGDTTFSTSILTGFKSGDSLVVCKKTTAMATFDF